jgi:tRNA (guanine37-N1)-methyltransferase
MKIDVLTLFPNVVLAYLKESIIGRAAEKELVQINVLNIRDYSSDKHKTVDDSPYGGGPGMILKPEPIFDALDKNDLWKGKKIFLSPQGNSLDHNMAERLATEKHLVILCGHYEGVDQRVCDKMDEEISIGDYVISNGAVASMVLIDAVVRQVPEVLGNSESVEKDSFANGLLEYPQYTRPAEFRGENVPDILLSGNHKLIEEWRRTQSLKKTLIRRPELLEKAELSHYDKLILEKIK